MWSEEKARLNPRSCNVLTWIIWWCVHMSKHSHTSTHTHRYKWHYWLNGQELEQTQGDSEGHGSLACCSSWIHRVRHNLGTEQQQNLFERQLLKSKSIFKEAVRTMLGFPYDLAGKESICSTGDIGSVDSRSGRSPGGDSGNPLWYSCLKNPMDRLQRVGHSKRLKRTEQKDKILLKLGLIYIT